MALPFLCDGMLFPSISKARSVTSRTGYIFYTYVAIHIVQPRLSCAGKLKGAIFSQKTGSFRISL
jgi:hypothetical protein